MGPSPVQVVAILAGCGLGACGVVFVASFLLYAIRPVAPWR